MTAMSTVIVALAVAAALLALARHLSRSARGCESMCEGCAGACGRGDRCQDARAYRLGNGATHVWQDRGEHAG